MNNFYPKRFKRLFFELAKIIIHFKFRLMSCMRCILDPYMRCILDPHYMRCTFNHAPSIIEFLFKSDLTKMFTIDL